jgi:hypothetical protein
VSVNPTDLLAERHKPYRVAQERYQRATAAREAANEKVAQLEACVHDAEARDRIALGDALIDQRKPPRPEADDARSRLEQAKREAEALTYAEERAAAALDQLPREHKTEWLSRADAGLAKACADYEVAIRQLAAARDRLCDQASLVSFLEHGHQSQPLSGAVQQRLSDGTVRQLAFEELVGLMLAECWPSQPQRGQGVLASAGA